MRLAKVELPGGKSVPAILEKEEANCLESSECGVRNLTEILHAENPRKRAEEAGRKGTARRVESVRLLAPLDQQEVWAAGVTYKRSQIARMEESEAGASHYDKVYTAPRPELFFKATPNRVSGPGEGVRVRKDSKWTVPEPEFTLVMRPDMKIVGYTIGNDMSARDIEGENPLYLPQAKVYHQCCSLGPAILLADSPLDLGKTMVRMEIRRGGRVEFSGETNLGMLKRTFEELAGWLGRENEFPNGVYLLTGTGIVPPDEFSLRSGDVIKMEVTGIGVLENPVI